MLRLKPLEWCNDVSIITLKRKYIELILELSSMEPKDETHTLDVIGWISLKFLRNV